MNSKSNDNPASPSIEHANSSQEAPPNEITLANQDVAEPGIDQISNEEPAKTHFTYQQKATFVSAILASFASMMSFSLITVFFPNEAASRGVSQTVIGLVFSAFALSGAISSPIWGRIIPTYGARFIFLAGGFVTGGCNLLFGFIDKMPTKETFTGFSFALRILEGLGSSAVLTSSAAIVALNFPDNVGTAMSLIEMLGGLTFAVGPAIGGLLFNAGGFGIPFFSLGGLVISIDILNFFLLPEVQGTRKKGSAGPLAQLFSIPAIWMALMALIVATTCFSSIDPILSIHLKELGFTVIQISLIFLGFGLSYALFSVIWGAVADAKKTTRIMMVIGSFGTAVFFLFLGPSPLLEIASTKLIPIVAVPLGTIVIGLMAIPTLVDMFSSAEWHGIPNDIVLTSAIAGIWNGGFEVGTVIGPSLSSALTEAFGFAYCTTIFAGILILSMILLCLFGVWEYRCGLGRRIPRSRLDLKATDEERKLLISSEV